MFRVFIRKGCWKLSNDFFCICLDDHMIFNFHTVNMVYCIYGFAYVDSSLHYRDYSYLIMAHCPFHVLFNLVTSILLRILHLYSGILAYRFLFFLKIILIHLHCSSVFLKLLQLCHISYLKTGISKAILVSETLAF